MPVPYKLTLLFRRSADHDRGTLAERAVTAGAGEALAGSGATGHVLRVPWPSDSPIDPPRPAPYDGLLETWWIRKNDAARWVASGALRRWLDQLRPLLAEPAEAVGGQPKVLWEREPASDPAEAVAMIFLPVARRSLTVQDFQAYWCGAHARVLLDGPLTRSRLRRFEVTSAQPPPSRFGGGGFDGLAVATFDSAEALRAELGSEHYRSRVRPAWRAVTSPERTFEFAVAPALVL